MANHPLINATSARSPGDRGLPPRRNEVSDPQKAELQSISGFLPKLLYERYGILENPFGVTPNPRYLYQSKTHAEARSSLIIGILAHRETRLQCGSNQNACNHVLNAELVSTR
jgi:hypothetical protein